MKFRNWAIVAGLLVVALGIAVYKVKLHLEHKKRLEYLVVQAVSPYINGSLQVGGIRLGFFSIHLKDVKIQFPAQAIAITVDDIRVTISVLKLFSSGFSLSRSIGRILLIGPTIEFSLAPAPTSESFRKPLSGSKPGSPVSVSRNLAVEFLFVKNGTIRLRDRQGQVTVLGEQLQGRMWDTGTELHYKLTGKLGAARRNLFVTGRISWHGERHHLSLKINDAEISHPLAFKDVVVAAGSLTGALEISFPDTVTVNDIQSNGWIRIRQGTCRVRTVAKPFDSVNAAISIANTVVTVDSFSGRYASARLRANGSWDLIGNTPSDRINFQCRNLWLDSLGLSSVRNACRVVGGGWVEGALERNRGENLELTVRGGGVTLWGAPLLELFAHGKFQRKQLAVDFVSLYSPAFTARGSGNVDYSKKTVEYSFLTSGTFDSLSLVQPGCAGKLRFSGTINGVGANRSGQFSLRGTAVTYSGMPLGAVTLTSRMTGDGGTFTLKNEERGCYIDARGALRGLFTGHPSASCTLGVKVRAASPFFSGRLARCPRPDTLNVRAFYSGSIDTFHVRMLADFSSAKVSGGVTFKGDRGPGRHAPAVWRIEPRNLRIGSVTSACNGSGRLYADSLTIDSLALFDRAVASGKLSFSNPSRIIAACNFDMTLKNLLGLVMKTGDAIEKGTVRGVVRFSGALNNIEYRSEVHVTDVSIGGISTLQTDATVTGSGSSFTVLPMVLRKDGRVVVAIDTIANVPHLRLSGSFDDLDLRAVFGTILPEETAIEGKITGSFCSSEQGLPITANLSSASIGVNDWNVDSIRLSVAIDSAGVLVRSLHACDGSRTVISGSGFVPLSFLRGEDVDKDNLQAVVAAQGDIIATLHHNLSNTIDGSGQGTLKLSITGQPENWHVNEGFLDIPRGTLLIKPYLRGKVTNFSCKMVMDDSSAVTTTMSGAVGKRSVRLFSTHDVPQGYEPIKIGPLDFGILQLQTPQHGLDIYLPGFMEKGESGDLEPTAKSPFRNFSLAGPANSPTVSGILLLRDLEFTYPLLEERESAGPLVHKAAVTAPSSNKSNVLSFVKWEMDVKAADRKVMYFRDISGNKTRLVRFLEAYIDQGLSLLSVRGRDIDNSLKISGIVKSYHGAVYYGKTFDRNFEAGLEFVPQKKNVDPGFDNLPVLWGSAEAYSDTSRFDRIKLTALVQDPKTGSLAERGRLVFVSGRLNVALHLSSEFEELPGESEREFYRQAGLQFTTISSAGKFMSDFGEQNLHRILLQRFERKLAKSIGLDVINVETSIASNYFTRFYNRQFDNQTMQADYLALANVGVTIGRYFFRDNLFVKASGGLLPLDTALTPQYSFGLEFQPTRYLFMNFDYAFFKRELVIEHNPRVNMQLRLPISGLRNFFDF
jgi:hypothetical protein